jgi:hypothetical protein
LETPQIAGIEHLRVLIANERKDRLALVVPLVADLGHEVIACEIDIKDVGAVTPGSDPKSRWSASERGSGASGTLVVTLTTMPSARPTTAPTAIAAPTLRA